MLVEGVERWRQADVEKHLAPVMSEMPPDTTLALFAREENRISAPAAVHEAVRSAGGQVVSQMTVKPWELAGWVREQAARVGVSLDAAAAKALVAQVGERQQRLLRELEKLALEGEETHAGGAARAIGVEDIEGRGCPIRRSGRPSRWPTRSLQEPSARRRCRICGCASRASDCPA